MPRGPAEKIRMEARRLKVEELFSRGMSPSQIAQDLGVHKSQITRDFQHIRKRRQETNFNDVNDAKQDELARIAEIEQKAWFAWDRSCEVAQTREVAGTVKSVTRGQAGNPRFLTIILECVKQRRAILGLDSPKTFSTGGQPSYKAYLFDPDNPPNPDDGRAA